MERLASLQELKQTGTVTYEALALLFPHSDGDQAMGEAPLLLCDAYGGHLTEPVAAPTPAELAADFSHRMLPGGPPLPTGPPETMGLPPGLDAAGVGPAVDSAAFTSPMAFAAPMDNIADMSSGSGLTSFAGAPARVLE